MAYYRIAWLDETSLQTVGFLFCHDRGTAQIRVGDICANMAAGTLQDDQIAQIPFDSHPQHGEGRTFVAGMFKLPPNHPLSQELDDNGTAWVDRKGGILSWSEANLLSIIRNIRAPYSEPKPVKIKHPNNILPFVARAARQTFAPLAPPTQQESTVFFRVGWQKAGTPETIGYTFHDTEAAAIDYVSAVIDSSKNLEKSGISKSPFPALCLPQHGLGQSFAFDAIEIPNNSQLSDHILGQGVYLSSDEKTPYFASASRNAAPTVWRQAQDAPVFMSDYLNYYSAYHLTSAEPPTPPDHTPDAVPLLKRNQTPNLT